MHLEMPRESHQGSVLGASSLQEAALAEGPKHIEL